MGTPGAVLAGVDFTGCDFESLSLVGLDFTGSNLTDVTFNSDSLNGTILTGATVTGAQFLNENPLSEMVSLVSGNLIGAPAALPSGESLVDGYLVQQASAPTTTTSGCVTSGGVRTSSTFDQFAPPSGTTGVSFDVIGGWGGNADGGVLGEGNYNINNSPGSGGVGGAGTSVTGSLSWSASDGPLYGSPGCGGFYGSGPFEGGTPSRIPGGAAIIDSADYNPAQNFGFGGDGGTTTTCSGCDNIGSVGGTPGGSGGGFSTLCGSADLFGCFVFAGGGGGGGGGGDEPGDNGGDGGSYSFPNGGDDGAGASSCSSGGAAGVNGGGGGAGYTNNGGGDQPNGNGGWGGEGGTDNDRNSGGGGGGGGGVVGGGGGGGNDSYDGFGCSAGGGGGAGSSGCNSGYFLGVGTPGVHTVPVTYNSTGGLNSVCSAGDSPLPANGLIENTGGQVSVTFSGYVAPPPIASGSLDWTYGEPVSVPLASLASVQPTFSEVGTLPNGVTFDSSTGVLSGTPTWDGTYSIEVTASDGFGSSSRWLTITVHGAATTTAMNLLPAVSYGTENVEDFAVSVSSSGVGPTGTVAVKAGSTTLCTAALSPSGGQCRLSNRELPAGTYAVRAFFSTSTQALESSSTSAAQTLVVKPAGTATTLKLLASRITLGAENLESFTVHVSAGAQGTVAVRERGFTLCTATLSSSSIGKCSLAPSELPVGAYKVLAVYVPSTGNFTASRSLLFYLTVGRPTG